MVEKEPENLIGGRKRGGAGGGVRMSWVEKFRKNNLRGGGRLLVT